MGRILTTTAVCTVLAATAVVAVPTSTAHQDIAEMTGTTSAADMRWTSRLERVSTGSDIEMIENTISSAHTEVAGSTIVASTVLGVRSGDRLTVLDRHTRIGSGQPAAIDRALKGDRVYTPSPAQAATVKLASVSSAYTAPSTAKIAASLQKETTELTVALKRAEMERAQRTANPKSIMPKHAMVQAREAARQMAKAQVTTKAAKGAITPPGATQAGDIVVTAYAPDAAQTKTDSAFAAVLRPGITKEAPKPKTILKAALKSASKPVRSVIKLAKGDHKWAARPLPKNSFSKKERKCLGVGVYFEARGESTKGQQAVAQVILNRVKNPAYPKTICGVVYQNKHKRNACQFSFACDGQRDKVNSRKHWAKSMKVANDAIDGKVWLTSVGSSSHYHADYVWPRWRKKMRKMTKIGRHIFYRTHRGGWS